ncbi:MAG: hypothetical protein K5685_05760 [Bacteroidales bacterium]|nr:hypothetical protein [Bacteroidales bacterium]
METLTEKRNRPVRNLNRFEINPQTIEAQLLIAYLKSLSFVKFLDEEDLPVS